VPSALGDACLARPRQPADTVPALVVEGISKDYGGVRALSDVSFSIEQGEKVALIGPNGAGKTTLFKVLAGELEPTAGRARVFDEDVTSLPAERRVHLGVGRAFQLTSLFMGLTVHDNALLAVLGTRPARNDAFRSRSADPGISAAVKDLLQTWDLWERREILARSLSFGEQRRLDIALSYASRPRLWLLDEPSSGLTAAESAAMVRTIFERGVDTTVLIVTHDMDVVFGVAHRIIVLHNGQVIADGVPEAIRLDPRVREIYMGAEEVAGHP
jgi:branched-chain amino acid transport system ATP-binding protein